MPDVVIKWPRCTLVFTEQEFRELLTAREDLWIAALRRGKGYSRAEKAQERKSQKRSEGIVEY